MAPFRPSNINKRIYPGNGSVIGPQVETSIGITTTTCFTSTPTCDSCLCIPLVLGCRCSFCACPFCNVCTTCEATLCDRTVPSGMWSSSEVYESRKKDSWGDTTTTCTPSTFLCCTNVGYACTSNLVDYAGYFYCCSGATKYLSAPSCTQYNGNWYNRATAVTNANNCMGSCGWYIPTQAALYCAWTCRVYMQSFGGGAGWYWANDITGGAVNFDNRGLCYSIPANQPHAQARAFRQF